MIAYLRDRAHRLRETLLQLENDHPQHAITAARLDEVEEAMRAASDGLTGGD